MQTTSALQASEDPALRAFFAAIDTPLKAYMAGLGEGEGPLRARNTGRYRLNGVWSVLLRSQGFHHDHIHPDGWISSAFYVETPPAVDREEGREGWLRFGRPSLPVRPALEADHFVRPEPGLLALFPSYMWHGTVPFDGRGERLSIAFDAVPA